MSKQTITAMFDTRAHADQAAAQLRQAGIPAADVIVSPDSVRDDDTAGRIATEKKGFWASLEEMFGGTEDHDTYAEGLRRGGTLLTAHVEDAHLDMAVDILERHGSVDLEERETSWRSEGWTGAGAATTGMAAAGGSAMGLAMTGTAAPVRVVETETVVERAPLAKAPAPVMPKPAVVATGAVGRGVDDVLQVVEERLSVGKRAVSRGKVRLHSYVVQKDVSEDVRLHSETVTLDRHAVDRPVAALGVDAFKERTIEMEEIDEEAVVAKSAHVVEEIGLRKDALDRTETIHDTLRSTKVDIEDDRTVGAVKTGLTGGFVSRLVKDMEVVGSDGRHVGKIDHVDGDTIKLKKMDMSSGGQHHLIPTSLVASVDGKAMLSVTADDAKDRWTPAG